MTVIAIKRLIKLNRNDNISNEIMQISWSDFSNQTAAKINGFKNLCQTVYTNNWLAIKFNEWYDWVFEIDFFENIRIKLLNFSAMGILRQSTLKNTNDNPGVEPTTSLFCF